MELTHSTEERLSESVKNPETRSILDIDLNEIPASSALPTETLTEAELEPEPIDVIRAFHDNPDPAPGPPACLPGETGPCGVCARYEPRELVVVCDGCERGFHLGCAGISGSHAVTNFSDWVCFDCAGCGVKSKRWPLGVKSKQILDINASPPSDGDGDEVQELRKHNLTANSSGALETYKDFVYPGNGSDSRKALEVNGNDIKLGSENIFSSHTVDRSFEGAGFGFPVGRGRGIDSSAFRYASQNPNEMFLQGLKDFVSQRHGILEEGWCVDLKLSLNGHGGYALYRAPNGRTFGTMLEVASYLGLVSNGEHSLMDTGMRTEGYFPQERPRLPKKRKKPIGLNNGFLESTGHYKEFPFSTHCAGTDATKSGNPFKDSHYGTFGTDGRRLQDANDGLPVQFEDFFVLTLGQIDARPLYHNASMIYPVGYRSCWHDKVTGSLFICEVSDGGVSGPIFTIKRSSCLESPIPKRSTGLFYAKAGEILSQKKEKHDGTGDYNWESDSIEMLLSDPRPPTGEDILSWFDNNNGAQTSESLRPVAGSVSQDSGIPLSDNVELDEIGEIFVEDHSSCAAWRKMSTVLVDVYTKILKQKGKLKLFCKHAENDVGSINCNTIDEKNKEIFPTLAKFCSSQNPLSIPRECQNTSDMDMVTHLLSEWLNQDRFGLDAGFVQEMIERLPGCESCSSYEFLRCRTLASTTVGSGFLIAKKKGEENVLTEAHIKFNGRFKKPRLGDYDAMVGRRYPPGKPLCEGLPPILAGDFHEVWEVFWRFYEVLGLKAPFASKGLKEELFNPWVECINADKFEKEVQSTAVLNLNTIGDTNRSSGSESRIQDLKENPHAFVQIETETTKDAAETSLASVTYKRCFGVALTKAHISLLQVLICELQSKVAAHVDPNFDSGESRSRRGRKKDVDLSLPAKRTKISMLPVNELTWPELARRYALAIVSMGGNLESADIIVRESGKVFRCLQGDGGVLCGSLTGVEGMEADAILLAEAAKKVFGSSKREKQILTIEDEGFDVPSSPKLNPNDGQIPEWAQRLEPVRKLPTNVGTRIRKCVNEALELNPPEWARKTLEHSISKEVYKGNASGPTKKAVISVLGEVTNLGLVQKAEKPSKKKNVLHISDIIMKQCRIVLRRALAADDGKVFCNLLGRQLLNSSDNDDEGLLGSPGMVSRPLDFRTIDLRLAVGAYGGYHEAFLEDVQELWNTIRAAYIDQPDFVGLAETLSQKFESLYEAEVITIVQKLEEHYKAECLTAEAKEDINSIVASTSEIPKAPWDEGVCKVCGVDKDDDSVLLCDTCDAEYHTYCLNPPLARIPKGNWYCPSCVIAKRIVQDPSLIRRKKDRKYQGEVTRAYYEAISNLASAMEVKEYLELSAEQRISLLKLLCDELLNSAVVRQHLEQSAEATAELQQRLRSLSLEMRNLRYREEVMAAKVAKSDTNIVNACRETGLKEALTCGISDLGKSVREPQKSSAGTSCIGIDLSAKEDVQEGSGLGSCSKNPCKGLLEGASKSKDILVAEDGSKDKSPEKEKFSATHELLLPSCTPEEIDSSGGQMHVGNLQKPVGKEINSPSQNLSDHQAICLPSEMVNLHVAEDVPLNESQASLLQFSAIKNEILQTQESIARVETQLLNQSIRREFLGSDSDGRLYWVSAMLDGCPHIIVDGSSVVQKLRNALPFGRSMNKQFGMSSAIWSQTCFEVQNIQHSLADNMDHDRATLSSWISYQTDSEINELVQWLKDNDSKERALKESIFCWKRSRFQGSQQARSQVQTLSVPGQEERIASPDCLVTKAATILEKKYGLCLELETEPSKKRGKNASATVKQKSHRCDCLEPVWPSRCHCLVCHTTFFTDVDLEQHHNGMCTPSSLASSKGKRNMNSISLAESNAKNFVGASKSRCYELSSSLIKFQNEGPACPFDFEKICSKFVTRDSNRDLVQEIGLIGSNGVPSFVPSYSPYLNDPTLMLTAFRNEYLRNESALQSKSTRNDACDNDQSSMLSRGCAADDTVEVHTPVLRCPQLEGRKPSDHHHINHGAGNGCVIPQTSLRPLVGKVSEIAKRLRINLLDMDAALPEEALRPSKGSLEQRCSWRAFVKSAETIYEMVQASILLEDMIKTEYLRNEWWYWSSLSAAVKISTLSSLALRIYSLDAAIIYEKGFSNLFASDCIKSDSLVDQDLLHSPDVQEKCKISRKSNRKRKEPEV